MSFAIIETGGKQYKVSASKILEIEKIDAEVGKTLKFKNVFLATQTPTRTAIRLKSSCPRLETQLDA